MQNIIFSRNNFIKKIRFTTWNVIFINFTKKRLLRNLFKIAIFINRYDYILEIIHYSTYKVEISYFRDNIFNTNFNVVYVLLSVN